jgi:hypothetical protein
MSLENVRRFGEMLKTDSQLLASLGEVRDRGEFLRRAVDEAGKHGVFLDSAELDAFLARAEARRDELTDEQLGNVAGGVSYVPYSTYAMILVACLTSL